MNHRNDRNIRLRPIKPGKFMTFTPADFLVFQCDGLTLEDATKERRKAYRYLAIRPFHHRIQPVADSDHNPEFLLKFTPQSFLMRLTGIHLSAGKFPKPTQMPV